MDKPAAIRVIQSGARSLAKAAYCDKDCCLRTLLLMKGTQMLCVLTAPGRGLDSTLKVSERH